MGSLNKYMLWCDVPSDMFIGIKFTWNTQREIHEIKKYSVNYLYPLCIPLVRTTSFPTNVIMYVMQLLISYRIKQPLIFFTITQPLICLSITQWPPPPLKIIQPIIMIISFRIMQLFVSFRIIQLISFIINLLEYATSHHHSFDLFLSWSIYFFWNYITFRLI